MLVEGSSTTKMYSSKAMTTETLENMRRSKKKENEPPVDVPPEAEPVPPAAVPFVCLLISSGGGGGVINTGYCGFKAVEPIPGHPHLGIQLIILLLLLAKWDYNSIGSSSAFATPAISP